MQESHKARGCVCKKQGMHKHKHEHKHKQSHNVMILEIEQTTKFIIPYAGIALELHVLLQSPHLQAGAGEQGPMVETLELVKVQKSL